MSNKKQRNGSKNTLNSNSLTSNSAVTTPSKKPNSTPNGSARKRQPHNQASKDTNQPQNTANNTLLKDPKQEPKYAGAGFQTAPLPSALPAIPSTWLGAGNDTEMSIEQSYPLSEQTYPLSSSPVTLNQGNRRNQPQQHSSPPQPTRFIHQQQHQQQMHFQQMSMPMYSNPPPPHQAYPGPVQPHTSYTNHPNTPFYPLPDQHYQNNHQQQQQQHFIIPQGPVFLGPVSVAPLVSNPKGNQQDQVDLTKNLKNVLGL